MFNYILNRDSLRGSDGRKLRSTRSRPTIESLEGRQLMSLNVFATPSAVETNQITKGPNGNLFFTETAANKIGEITTAGAVTEFTIPTPNSQPTAITAGPDGNLYFTGTTFIGRITTKGVITEFPLPTKDSFPGTITAGPDGNLYFAETSPVAGIGRITTSGVIIEIPIPASGGITAGPDGNIWVTEDGKIAQFVLAKPVVTPTPASASSTASASPAVGSTTNQAHVAATDAAIEALSSGDSQEAAIPSTVQWSVVDPSTPTGWHKKV